MLKHIKNLLERNSFLLALLVTALIAYLSLSNPVQLDSKIDIAHLDKIFHSLAYFGLTICWLFALRKYPKYKLVSLVLFLYGILLEFMQGYLTENREQDVLDVVANSSGIIVAMLIFDKLYKYLVKIFDR